MARMTLSELTTEIQRWIPDKSEASVKAAANFALRILGKHAIFWPRYRHIFTTTADWSGTNVAAVTNGATTMTVTGIPNDCGYQFLRIENDELWYQIYAWGSGGNISLFHAYGGTTDVAANATLAYPLISLPADLLTIDAIREPNRPPLQFIGGEIYPQTADNPDVGRPTQYYRFQDDTETDVIKIMLLPYPDAAYSFVVEGRRRLTLYDTSSTYCGLPSEHEDLLIAGTLGFLWSQEDSDQRGAFWLGAFERGIRLARSSSGQRVLGTVERLGLRSRVEGQYPELATDNAL